MPKDELIGRLEAATGPDRELDCEIALAVDGGEIVWKMANYTMESYPARRYASANHVGGYGNAPVPLYTTSIDAALTLLPEGYYPIIDFALKRCFIRDPKGFDHDPPAFCVKARTPALAIVIAALRATERGEAGR